MVFHGGIGKFLPHVPEPHGRRFQFRDYQHLRAYLDHVLNIKAPHGEGQLLVLGPYAPVYPTHRHRSQVTRQAAYAASPQGEPELQPLPLPGGVWLFRHESPESYGSRSFWSGIPVFGTADANLVDTAPHLHYVLVLPHMVPLYHGGSSVVHSFSTNDAALPAQ